MSFNFSPRFTPHGQFLYLRGTDTIKGQGRKTQVGCRCFMRRSPHYLGKLSILRRAGTNWVPINSASRVANYV
jgi:hypothetical protein